MVMGRFSLLPCLGMVELDGLDAFFIYLVNLVLKRGIEERYSAEVFKRSIEKRY